MANAPTKVTIRAYNVGFGDCLLVTFHYASRDRFILIDYGSTRAPQAKENKPNFMREIADDIAKVCGGKLDAVIATHRHRDHISGFATGTAKKPDTGDIIRALKPDVVLQPWTEDPKASEDALGPVSDPGPDSPKSAKNAVAGFRASLANMHQVAADVARFSKVAAAGRRVRAQLEFLGEENLANKSAVENLASMGKQQVYGYFGSKSGLESVLPGVKTWVLGPPTLKQTDSIRKQASKNKDEFWHLYRSFTSFWGFQAASPVGAKSLFRHAETHRVSASQQWIADRIRAVQTTSMLSIVRQLDDQMNNTSLILLFDAGKKHLLFPGDAQLENWMYALETLKKQGKISMLSDVDLYKVGHHGSLNATPKTLWNGFKKKGTDGALQTVLSTKPGVHGSTAAHTEVPRKTLLDELEKKSQLTRTDDIKAKDALLCRTIEIDL